MLAPRVILTDSGREFVRAALHERRAGRIASARDWLKFARREVVDVAPAECPHCGAGVAEGTSDDCCAECGVHFTDSDRGQCIDCGQPIVYAGERWQHAEPGAHACFLYPAVPA
jgi:hypothetical protein